MRVCFFTEGWTPSTRFRVMQYLPHLAKRGIHGTVRYFRDEEFPLGGFRDVTRYPVAVRDDKTCLIFKLGGKNG